MATFARKLVSPRPWSFWVIVVLSGLGIGVLLYHTRFGTAVTGDAVQYIAGARSLIAGTGFSMLNGSGQVQPITAFPPFFSTVMAAIGLMGFDPLQIARYLNATLFGLNIALVGLLLYRHSGSNSLAVLAALLVMTSKTLVVVHASAMSEPLFITMELVNLYALTRYAEAKAGTWVVVAGAAVGLSAVTRFVGLALVGAGGLALMVLGDHDWRDRARAALVYGALGILPFAYWSARNLNLVGSATARPMQFLITRTRLALMLGEASSWVFPESIVRRTRILLLAGLLLAGVLLLLYLLRAMWRDWRLPTALRWFSALLAASLGSYLAGLWASIAFLDASMEITHRYLSPAYVVSWVLLVLLLWSRFGRVTPASPTGRAVLLGALVVFSAHAWAGVGHLRNPGLVFGYTDTRFPSGTVQALQQLHPKLTIVTNQREKVYILSGRPAFSVPLWLDHFTKEPREDFPQQMQAYWDRMHQGAVLALFDDYLLHQDPPTTSTLTEGLVLLVDANDGSLYVDPQAWLGSLPDQ